MREFSTRLVAAIALCWGALVWGNWLVHNPVSLGKAAHAVALLAAVPPGPAVRAWGGHLVLLVRLGWLALAALGAGAPAFGWLMRRGGVPGSRLGSLALGAGLLGMAVLGLGCLGLVYANVAWAVTAAGVVAAARGARGVPLVPPWRWLVAADTWPLTLVLGVGCGCALLGALAPEVSFDALAHHLAHPQVYAAAHRVVALPHHFLSHYPALLEMQYLLALLLGGGAPLAKLVHFGWGIVTLAALAAWARESLEDRWALAAVAGVALLPYVQVVLMWAYVDLGAAAYLTLAARAVAGGLRGAGLAGVLAGLCMGTKATGLFGPVLIAALLAVHRPSRGAWVLYLAGVGCLTVPWAVKNWAEAGNPAAPFFAGVIPTLWWSPANQARYARELTSYAPGHLFGGTNLLAQPWRTSVLNEGVLDRMAGMSGWFLWAIPLLALVDAPAARLPARLALGFFALWLFAPRQARYLLPAWPAAALAAVHALRALARRGGPGLLSAWLAGGLLVLHLAAAFEREHYVINPEPVVFGGETPEAYLARGLPEKPYCVRVSRLLRERHPADRILVVSQYGLALLWGGRAVTQSAFDTPLIERWAGESPDPAAIRKRFRQAGIAHVLYSTNGGFLIHAAYDMYNFSPAAAGRWRAFWSTYADVELNQDDRFMVYRLRDRPVRPRAVGVLPGLDEQWLGKTDAMVREAEANGTIERVLPVAEAAYAQVADATRSGCAWERVGSMRLRRGDMAGARRALEEAERLGRGTSVLYDALGVIEARAGDPGPAARRFRRALTIEPGLEDARRNLAQVLWNLGDRAAALGVLRQGLVLNPESGELGSLWSAWTGQAPAPP